MIGQVKLTWYILDRMCQIDRWCGYHDTLGHQQQSINESLADSVAASCQLCMTGINQEEVFILVARLKNGGQPKTTNEMEAAGLYYTLDELNRNYQKMAFTKSNIQRMLSYLHENSGGKGVQPDFLMEDELDRLLKWTKDCIQKKCMHPLVVIAVFEFEFLRIHHIEEGPEKFSRLLSRWLLLRLGYEIMQVTSIEKSIFENEENYYDQMRNCQAHPNEYINPWLEVFLDTVLQTCSRVKEQQPVPLKIQEKEEKLTPRKNRIMNYLKNSEPIQVGELSEILGLNINTLKKDLKELIELGYLNKMGQGKGTYYYQ